MPNGTLLDEEITGVERTYKLDEGFLEVGEEKTFNLRAWISNDVDASDWTSSTKLQYKFRIGVSSNEQVANNNQGGGGQQSGGITLHSSAQTSDTAVYSYCEVGVQLGSILSNEHMYLEDSGNLITEVTNDYTTLNKSFFLRHIIENNEVTRNDVCFIKDNTLYCLKGRTNEDAGSDKDPVYYEDNYALLLEVFGPDAIENEVCSDLAENAFDCVSSDFEASIGPATNFILGDGACTVESYGAGYCH